MSAPTGTIHDLGYQRYVGTRRAAATRWRVIMRHQIATGWKKWWHYKLALFFAVVTAFVAGGFLYFATNNPMRGVVRRADELMLTMADAALPMSLAFFWRAAFVLSLTLGSAIVATDRQTGAFTFYFVRSIRPRDYVIGKLAGYGVLVATVVVAGPVLLAGMRLGMCDDLDDVIAHLDVLPKAALIGALATVVYTAIPLAFSALVANRRNALALWTTFYILGGAITAVLANHVSSTFGALDFTQALSSLAFTLFDIKLLGEDRVVVEPWLAAVSVVAHAAVAIALLWHQVARAQRTGVGGGS